VVSSFFALRLAAAFFFASFSAASLAAFSASSFAFFSAAAFLAAS
jgi:hypothetical protein